ncbi:MAG: formylmethanofuran--tetrahydromethanopterin N-formyltransferase [Thermoprotei archaeon]|nr:MAG: formylmethanofuran--tetrahydromethanopterin N-formyltransferase [Thermoprotei archaeon]
MNSIEELRKKLEDSFAEAFPMYGTRLLITARDRKWALTAARCATGFATSIIACPAEAGIEKLVSPKSTPDGRPGVYIQIYHRSIPELKVQVLARVGQTVLTCPTTALFDGLPKVRRRLRIGQSIAKFGDGYEVKDAMYGRTVWRIPVMEGEFIVEDSVGVVSGVAGGNIVILARDLDSGLRAATEAVRAIRRLCPYVICPFPGGIVRSGSKVGSNRYPKLPASTNHPYCPTLRGKVPDTKVPPNVNCVYEIVINGLKEEYVKLAMGVGAIAAAKVNGVIKITSVNFGGKLGRYRIPLLESFDYALKWLEERKLLEKI